MRLHDLKLVSVEGLTLEEDGVGNRDLADIVQQAGATDSGDVSGGESEFGADQRRDLGDRLRVTSHPVVSLVNGAGERRTDQVDVIRTVVTLVALLPYRQVGGENERTSTPTFRRDQRKVGFADQLIPRVTVRRRDAGRGTRPDLPRHARECSLQTLGVSKSSPGRLPEQDHPELVPPMRYARSPWRNVFRMAVLTARMSSSPT